MQFFVDTAVIADIRELNDYGLLDGVTTNPSLIAKSGRDFKEVIAEICALVEGPVSAEVAALDAQGMIAEGTHLAAIAPNVVVKLPLTLDGLKAAATLPRRASAPMSPCAFRPTRRCWRPRRGRPMSRPSWGGSTTSTWTGWN